MFEHNVEELEEAIKEGYDTLYYNKEKNKWAAIDASNRERTILLDFKYPVDKRYEYNILKLILNFVD